MKKLTLMFTLLLLSFSSNANAEEIRASNFSNSIELANLLNAEVKYYYEENGSLNKTSQPKLVAYKIAREIKNIKYKDEGKDEFGRAKDYLQSFSVTKQLMSGDCEDMALFVLVRLVQEGFNPDDLGFWMYEQKNTDFSHIDVLLWIKNKPFVMGADYFIDARKNLKSLKHEIYNLRLFRGAVNRKQILFRYDSFKDVFK